MQTYLHDVYVFLMADVSAVLDGILRRSADTKHQSSKYKQTHLFMKYNANDSEEKSSPRKSIGSPKRD